MTSLGRASAVLDPAALGWPRHGVARQGPGAARRVRVGLLAARRAVAKLGAPGQGMDSRGGGQPSGFEAPTPTRGLAGLVSAVRGFSWQCGPWHGRARSPQSDRQPLGLKARALTFVARHGGAARGGTWWGMAGQGISGRMVAAGFDSPPSTQGRTWRGVAWLDRASLRWAVRVVARQGMEQPSGRQPPRFEAWALHAWPGMSGPGAAWWG